MDKIIDVISEKMKKAFKDAGYDENLGKVTWSNRPDLCEFQCNGAMVGAKKYKVSPIIIAQKVSEQLQNEMIFQEVLAVAPGFLNLKIQDSFLKNVIDKMKNDKSFGVEKAKNPKTIIIDYGGPNVAKPLHVGHLRSAVIGESIKRIARYMGHKVIGDIHLGDWGLQMGLIITELRKRKPDMVYFDESFSGEYPKEPPFTISELEEIYPTASNKSKEDEAYKIEAMQATYYLQSGVTGYRKLWEHILTVSIEDLKKNYANLNVDFDLWNGESDVQELIPGMVAQMKEKGYTYISDGALVVDVKEETDTKEMPPCMILKSDGASLYNTTDLATIMQRMETMNPDEMIYVVDKRQGLYFEQVFRCARKTKLITAETKLKFLGFGTMNGKDGKPFKTRQGGVMRLENLIKDINEEMTSKIIENTELKKEEAEIIAKKVALSAIKYGDLSNVASKDYIFDTERFTSFEGDTGPYILYTVVRIKSILTKYIASGNKTEDATIKEPRNEIEKALMLEISKFNDAVSSAYDESAPHKICAYIYDLANAFNHFYHVTKILSEEKIEYKEGWIALLVLTRDLLETGIDLLGFEAPERM